MKTLNPKIHLTDPKFKYTSAAKTDIRETFKKFTESNQNSKEPLVAENPLVIRNAWGLPEIPPPKRLG